MLAAGSSFALEKDTLLELGRTNLKISLSAAKPASNFPEFLFFLKLPLPKVDGILLTQP
jgi:hypothetical protein